jgi:hypothetical protein
MTESEKKLFAQAVAEGLVEKYDAQIATIDENVVCSKRHNRRMQRILEGKSPTNGRISKKTIGAILLAAALLLTGCTAYVFRNEIRDFFVKAYDSFVKVTFDPEQQGDKESIEVIYRLAYVMDGYELVNEESTSIDVIYEYRNSAGNTLTFEQYLLDGTNFILDSEHGNAEQQEIEGYRLYYKYDGQQYFYIWNDGTYAMTLTSNTEITNDDLINLLNGIEPVN